MFCKRILAKVLNFSTFTCWNRCAGKYVTKLQRISTTKSITISKLISTHWNIDILKQFTCVNCNPNLFHIPGRLVQDQQAHREGRVIAPDPSTLRKLQTSSFLLGEAKIHDKQEIYPWPLLLLSNMEPNSLDWTPPAEIVQCWVSCSGSLEEAAASGWAKLQASFTPLSPKPT